MLHQNPQLLRRHRYVPVLGIFQVCGSSLIILHSSDHRDDLVTFARRDFGGLARTMDDASRRRPSFPRADRFLYHPKFLPCPQFLSRPQYLVVMALWVFATVAILALMGIFPSRSPVVVSAFPSTFGPPDPASQETAASCEATRFHISEQPNENYFYSDCHSASQVVISNPAADSGSGAQPRLLVRHYFSPLLFSRFPLAIRSIYGKG